MSSVENKKCCLHRRTYARLVELHLLHSGGALHLGLLGHLRGLALALAVRRQQ